MPPLAPDREEPPLIAATESALDSLRRRAPRLADVVEASSRRRDVRELRARILLVLSERACPAGGRPARRWYVPGAVARFGVAGLHRSWRDRWAEEPPSLRTLRGHLRELEALLAIVRSPGDHLPRFSDPRRPEIRPRYADTIHVLADDHAARWWAGEGRELLESHPGARTSPGLWRSLFAGWRELARTERLAFDTPPGEGRDAPRGESPRRAQPSPTPESTSSRGPVPSRAAVGTSAPLYGAGASPPAGAAGIVDAPLTDGPSPRVGPGWDLHRSRSSGDRRGRTGGERVPALSGRPRWRELAAAVARRAGPWDLAALLRAAGADLRGRNLSRVCAEPGRLEASVALLARALRRGDAIRSLAGWVCRAWAFATRSELRAAVAWCRAGCPE